MTIRHLKIFIAVAEYGSMNTAARELYLSQPTISQAVREMEEHYGTRLFDRLSRKLHITPAGQELLDSAYQVVGQFDQMERTIQKSYRRSMIRIGSTITVGSCLISNVLNDLSRSMPDAETYTFIGNTHMIEEKLLRSELDIALVEGEVHHQDLIMVPCIRDFLVLGCSRRASLCLPGRDPCIRAPGPEIHHTGTGKRYKSIIRPVHQTPQPPYPHFLGSHLSGRLPQCHPV